MASRIKKGCCFVPCTTQCRPVVAEPRNIPPGEQKRKGFSVGIRWPGGRGLHTTRSIAQVVNLGLRSMLRLVWMNFVANLMARKLSFIYHVCRGMQTFALRLCREFVHVAFSRMVWSTLRCPSKRGNISMCCSNGAFLHLGRISVHSVRFSKRKKKKRLRW